MPPEMLNRLASYGAGILLVVSIIFMLARPTPPNSHDAPSERVCHVSVVGADEMPSVAYHLVDSGTRIFRPGRNNWIPLDCGDSGQELTLVDTSTGREIARQNLYLTETQVAEIRLAPLLAHFAASSSKTETPLSAKGKK